jgi:hypothetical protein
MPSTGLGLKFLFPKSGNNFASIYFAEVLDIAEVLQRY